MSLVKDTIEAFPLGRTTAELLVLLDVDFDVEKRRAVIAELEDLARKGRVRRDRDGRWRPLRGVSAFGNHENSQASLKPQVTGAQNTLVAAPARFSQGRIEADPEPITEAAADMDPAAVLRYWRSALRADPRGAVTQAPDRHGTDWHLVTGTGPIVMERGRVLEMSISLDALAPDFRQALVRREADDQSLAIGWPISVGRKSGVPAIRPAGLLSAQWQRSDGRLVLSIEADDILVNQDWLHAAARDTSWSRGALEDVFAIGAGGELSSEEFAGRLREAMASQVRGQLNGTNLLSEISANAPGLYDIVALFLPSESSFTAGAVRDLDAIASWPKEKLARTALAPLLGLEHRQDPVSMPAINTGPLNAEQIGALRNACTQPLSVVAGPPGTGKSQVIVSMAASVIAAGGSVLVASKNHQALDAVEERLGGLAEGVNFVVRTLDPRTERDTGFAEVLASLVTEPTSSRHSDADDDWASLRELAEERARLLDSNERRAELECEIAELLEKRRPEAKAPAETRQKPISLLQRLLRLFRSVDAETKDYGARTIPPDISALRSERDATKNESDPVDLTNRIADAACKVLPPIFAQRIVLDEDTRQELVDAKDAMDLEGSSAAPFSLARDVIRHRPLWLASVLGTPKRIPLDDGLFDLVIFDEASQCDIASAIPLFARARRSVVVGDDRQLAFIPSLGRKQDRNLMAAQGLPIGSMSRMAQSIRSLFDAAVRVKDVPRVMLAQQYRSAGPIVDYISTEFYGGKLRTAYDPATLRAPKGMKPGLAWTDVPAPVEPMSGNVNRAEVSAVARHLKMLLVEQGYIGSVGVIAPFRSQVAALEAELASCIPATAREAADLRVATVDRFQGQERDLILFSPCLGASSAESARTFVQRDLRRLNVAISRARAVAHVFGDLNFARSGKVAALARLAAYATEPRVKSSEGVFDSEWERRVYHALKNRGLEPVPQYEIAGRRLDFALFGGSDVKLDLEVDGRRWHQDIDGRRKLSDHWRDHQMKSLGWRVRRFWVDELATDMEGCLDLVERDLA